MVGKTNVPLSLGTKVGSLEVGSIVKMNISGTAWEWLIVHQGLPSSMYDESCDGTWVLLKNIYINKPMFRIAVFDYPNSNVHSYLNGEFIGLLDSGIASLIKEVKIPYNNGRTVYSGANGLTAKAFVLTTNEEGLTSQDESFILDFGAKLSYFDSGVSSSANSKRNANRNGAKAAYWFRDGSLVNLTGGFIWSSQYEFLSSQDADGNSGVRPTVILPSDALIDSDHNVIA